MKETSVGVEKGWGKSTQLKFKFARRERTRQNCDPHFYHFQLLLKSGYFRPTPNASVIIWGNFYMKFNKWNLAFWTTFSGSVHFIYQGMSVFCLCRHCWLFISVVSSDSTIWWYLSKFDPCCSWEVPIEYIYSLATWIKGDLGQCRNLFNRAHILGNMWNLMEQMVILAIRTVFVNSDCNHSHQHGCHTKEDILAADTLQVVRRGACAAATRGWRLSLADSQRVYTGVRGWDTRYEKQVSWLSQPDLECCEQDSWLPLQPVFQQR